jgi:hypothetical protein
VKSPKHDLLLLLQTAVVVVSGPDRQIAPRIVHDAIAEQQFAVKFEDGEPMSKTPEYVVAGAILKSVKSARTPPSPPIHILDSEKCRKR